MHLLKFHATLGQCLCCTEIQSLAIGRKYRESLIHRVLFQQWRDQQLIVGNVINLQIGSRIKHLHPILVTDMEHLTGGVGRIGDILARRMPIGIDTESESLRSGCIVSRHLPFHSQDSCAMSSTNMQTQVPRIGTIEAMAVDTTIELGVDDEWTFVERREVALVNTHFAPHLITRFNQSVSQSVVDAVLAHIDSKRLETVPAIIVFCRHLHLNLFASIISQELMPEINVEVG